MKEKIPFRVTPFRILLLLTLLTVAVTLVILWQIFAQSTNPLFSFRRDVQVPELTGLTREAAMAQPEALQLAVEWQEAYSPAYEAGIVFRQQPQAGRTVKQGQRLVLTVSKGADWHMVPDVKGLTREEALEALQEEGFSIAVEFLEDGTLPAYTVVKTEPAAGAQALAGDRIKVVVACPVPDPFRSVPNVTGMSLAEARRRLLEVGLQPIAVPSDAVDGTVSGQQPLPSHLVRVNERVYLYL